MNLRFCALFVSTLLSGCVLTDETNLTGGDFLAAHGAKAGDTTSRSMKLPVQFVEAIPLEGVPGANGTEDIALGNLGKDSLRVILGFDLSNKASWGGKFLEHKDSTLRLRLVAKDSFPGMTVRVRFVFLDDASYLPGLFLGQEPSSILTNPVVVDTELVVGSAAAKAPVFFALPGSVSRIVTDRMADSTKVKAGSNGWLAVLLDTRAGSSNAKTRFDDSVHLVAPDTVWPSGIDTSRSFSVGTFEGTPAWMTVGFRPAGSPLTLGLWPSGGYRLRAHLNTAGLRSAMYQAFSITSPDSAGGFDNTFHVLQARVTTGLTQVKSESSPASLSIASSVILESGSVTAGAPGGALKDVTLELPISAEGLRVSGLTSKPSIKFGFKPGVYSVVAFREKDSVTLSTRQTLVTVGDASSRYHSYIAVGDSMEFRLMSQLRVRVVTSPTKLIARFWRLEEAPKADDQSRGTDSLRHDAYLWSGATSLTQEIRTPLGQALNRNKPVEFDLVPFTTTTNLSNRLIVEPADPAKLFESVQVVARPLVGRNF